MLEFYLQGTLASNDKYKQGELKGPVHCIIYFLILASVKSVDFRGRFQGPVYLFPDQRCAVHTLPKLCALGALPRLPLRRCSGLRLFQDGVCGLSVLCGLA